MKKLFYLAAATLLIASCGNNKSDDETNEDVEITEQTFVWQSNMDDSTGKLKMSKDKPIGNDSLTTETIIAYLNSANPQVQLEFIKTSNDTIYLRIPSANYLTQQMGSTGPMMYFAAAVYNLTELPGITHVNFDFEEGDHASPSVLNRESFKDE